LRSNVLHDGREGVMFCRGFVKTGCRQGEYSAVGKVVLLLLDSLSQPLLHHGLIIEIAGAREALDPCQHSWVKSQSDGSGFAGVRLMHGSGHELGPKFVLKPIRRLFLVCFETGNVSPRVNGIHS